MAGYADCRELRSDGIAPRGKNTICPIGDGRPAASRPPANQASMQYSAARAAAHRCPWI